VEGDIARHYRSDAHAASRRRHRLSEPLPIFAQTSHFWEYRRFGDTERTHRFVREPLGT
jgi:hypothetical protein